MDGNFGGYLPGGYSQPGQQSQHQQSQHQQQHNLASFGNLSAQNHQQDSSHTTLPPLQGQNGGQFGSLSFAHPGSNGHTPTAPHTPSTMSMPQSATSAYSTMSPAHTQGSMLPPSSFGQSYPMSQTMAYPSSTATAMSGMTAGAGLPNIRPMPPGGVSSSSMSGLPSLSSIGQNGQQPSFMQNEEAPTHVVGSQGRRGVLPSAPGRPAAPAQGTATAKSMIPQKDADGKYPCPHCNKTYLHAKHLKRHLLRHTGDRPYMCHLCKDTFSRSDILKRHFQKCSIRRGNPTGANHLAHQRRTPGAGNRLSISQQDGPIGLAGMPEVAGSSANYSSGMVTSSPTVNGDMSGRPSRANSLSTVGTMSQRNSVAGLGILGSNAPSNGQNGTSAGYQQPLPAFMQSESNGGHMQSNYPYGQSHMNGNGYNNAQQMSFLGQQSSRFDHNHNSHSPYQQHTNGDTNGGAQQTDWSRMFNSSGQDGFIARHPPNAGSQIKTESDVKPNYGSLSEANESFLGSLYSHPPFGSEYSNYDENGIPGFPNWSLDDPLQAKVESLTHYCFPDGPEAMAGDSSAQLMNACLTVENIKHFAEHYKSYQGHWPTLHMPTFKLTEANNGLVLAMIVIGAVYSPKLDVNQVRQLMDFARMTVTNNSSIYSRTMTGQTDGMGSTEWDIEELQALLMLQTVFSWNGTRSQRKATRESFPTLVRIAKAMNLLQQAGPGHFAYSPLHNCQHTQRAPISAEHFNWHAWLAQEQRNRVLYQLYLTDAAMVMFFNMIPQIDSLDMRLMLPTDDAAWDARDSQECANALGLNGPQAQSKNLTGTRRPSQPSMRDAMRTLIDAGAMFNPSSTNAYAKFILVHAIIVRIIACQKTILLQDSSFQGFVFGPTGSGPATPLSQNDWLDMHRGPHSATNSGQVTPTEGFSTQTMAAEHEKRKLGNALDKWKRNWDYDMELQYPPGDRQRRFGFSRDGVHFFYLGRSFFQSQSPRDWTLEADKRFQQVMSLLKRIKGFVLGDNETKGHDIGSVGDIDDQYGLDDLTLDMKLLFKPYNSLVDSPIAGIRTH
ncbi:hypothetical protein LTR78_008076 [Recurvomyces mirabilis]|uniref:C2H2-type domain-containing protein n=1 Tax=Recurvomyces mirabilis TaxID=574656 RepID=A0AAE0WJ45_9PEZI|nr:hypothetical protein LTR78_008076 [Recurvomyces mirabilis]KAK5150803.1 hypothetical protein LTS14_009867 [Recurvomyces mirabilis]